LGVFSTITAQPDLQIRYSTCSGGAAGCLVNKGRTSPRRPGFAPERAAEIARARTADFTDFTERTTDADLRDRALRRAARRGVRREVRRDALDAAIFISSPYYAPLLLTAFNYFLRRSTIK
jgi:hypothetical protein